MEFESIRYLFRTRCEIAGGASLLSSGQQDTLLGEVEPSVMSDGTLNIFLYILELFSDGIILKQTF